MEHNEVVHITRAAIRTETGVKVLVTEYRADGCVTWRDDT